VGEFFDNLVDWFSEYGLHLLGLCTFLIVGFLIADCAGGSRLPPIPAIVDHHGYRAAYTTFQSHCVGRDSHGGCTSSITVPVHHPPEWWLVIATDENAGHERVRVDVPPITWEQVKDGHRARLSCRRGIITNTCWAPRLSL
jgi:hypothetical protein